MSKEKQIHIRITDEEKEKMLLKANELGFKQLSEYLRFVGLNSNVSVDINSIKNVDSPIIHFTKLLFLNEIKFDDKDQLYPKTIEILNDPSKLKIIQGVRQSRKSFILKVIALYTAIHTENKTIGVVSYSQNRSDAFMKDIKESYTKLSVKPGVTILNKTQITFDNGSSIFCKTCSPDAFRGMGIDLLLFDEMAFFDNEKAIELWDSMIPCLNAANKSIIVASTRKNRSQDNLFWKLWSNINNEYDNFKRFSISSKDVKRTADFAKNMKEIIGDKKYENEFIIRMK